MKNTDVKATTLDDQTNSANVAGVEPAVEARAIASGIDAVEELPKDASEAGAVVNEDQPGAPVDVAILVSQAAADSYEKLLVQLPNAIAAVLNEQLPALVEALVKPPSNEQDKRDAEDAAARELAVEKQRKKDDKAAEKAREDAAKARAEAIANHQGLYHLMGDQLIPADVAVRAGLLSGDATALLKIGDGATLSPDFEAQVTAADVTESDDGLLINAQIDFPASMPSFKLAEAILFFGGSYSRCAVGPVMIGGGGAAQLSAKSLVFRFVSEAASGAPTDPAGTV